MKYSVLLKAVITFFIISFQVYATQPIWVVKTLNNIRRSIVVANRAKNASKAIFALGKFKHALPDNEIETLAKIASKNNGLKIVGEILGKKNFIAQYGDDLGHLVLQDTYLRIAIKNGRISRRVATEALEHLGGTPGLTTLLRKINSMSFSQSKGHMRELQIALSAQKRGFRTVSLGQKFADGLKHGNTDLDVLLRRGTKNFAIESKAYVGKVPESMIRADANSLVEFCKHIDDTVPVFCFETMPSKFSQQYLANKGVKVVKV